MTRKNPKKAKEQPAARMRCRDCRHAEIVTKFHTLNIQGAPTMARCKHQKYYTLLSWPACNKFENK